MNENSVQALWGKDAVDKLNYIDTLFDIWIALVMVLGGTSFLISFFSGKSLTGITFLIFMSLFSVVLLCGGLYFIVAYPSTIETFSMKNSENEYLRKAAGKEKT